MKEFYDIYNSLINKIDGNIDLSSVLEFCTYFRCDDIKLYNDFMKNYTEVGYYKSEKLIELYCKKNGIILSDENANSIFSDLVNNIWNNGMSYHLTTSISALNINKYGMDPSKKEADVLEDINTLIDSLSEEKVKYYFPFVRGDINMYSYSSIPKLSVSYGKAPEWYLNLAGYGNESLDKIIPRIMNSMEDESEAAKEKMVSIVSKYHELYKNSFRVLVVIPGLNPKLSKDVLDSFEVNSVEKLNEGINYFLSVKGRNIDAKTDKVVPSNELMFIDVKTRTLVNFEGKNKKHI